MYKKIAALLLALTITTGTFASAMTRAEYAKEIINTSTIELTQMPGGSEAVTNEDYIYTALQNGLFKGVSFKFDGEITPEEIETMNANLKALNLSDAPEEGTQESQEDGVENKQTESETALNFETPYGTILTPDESLIDGLWSDDEFHDYLMAQYKKNGYMIHEPFNIWVQTEDRPPHYYDPELRHFFLMMRIDTKDENGVWQSRNDYVDLDEVSNGRVFKAIKIAAYLKHKNPNLEMSMYELGYKSVCITFRDTATRSVDFKLQISTDPNSFDRWERHFDAYDTNQTNITTSWIVNKLWDQNVYAEYGVNLSSAPNVKIQEVKKAINFMQQEHVNTFFAVLKGMYGDDALNIYHAFMTAYLEERHLWNFDRVDVEKYEKVESDSHNIWFYNPKQYQHFYGIEDK